MEHEQWNCRFNFFLQIQKSTLDDRDMIYIYEATESKFSLWKSHKNCNLINGSNDDCLQ